MNLIDKDADAIVSLFLKKHLNKRYPPSSAKSNPIFKKRGNSFDFKNIREYQLNDDLRKIDWKLYGRTSKYFIKEFYEEESLPIYIVVDKSKSMNIIELDYYKRLLATFTYILLKLQYTVNIITVSNNIEKMILGLKGTKKLYNLNNFLNNIKFENNTNLLKSFKSINSKFHPSIIYLFSDMFCSSNFKSYFNNFKRPILAHMFYQFKDNIDEYSNYTILDNENSSKYINISYDKIMKKNILKQENQFKNELIRLSNEGNFKYTTLDKSINKTHTYINLLELLYD